MIGDRTKFWELWHFPAGDTYEEDGKRIGLYSSEAKARDTMASLLNKSGFRDHPEGFKIYETVLDQTGWADGFEAEAG